MSKIPFQPYLKLQVHLETKWKDCIFSKCTLTHCSSPEGAEGTVFVCSLLGWTVFARSLSFYKSVNCKCVIYSFFESNSEQSLFTLIVSFHPHVLETVQIMSHNKRKCGTFVLLIQRHLSDQRHFVTKKTSKTHAHPLFQQ